MREPVNATLSCVGGSQGGLISMWEPVTTLDGTLFKNVSLTHGGWEQYEAEKRKA